jgi:hypothetical protein
VIPSATPSAYQVEAIEAAAWADLQRSLPMALREQLGVTVHDRSGATLLLASGSRELAINRVIGLGLQKPLSRFELDGVVAEYTRAGVERFIIQWSPAALPSQATAWFSERGFINVSSIAKMYRQVDATAQPPAIDTALRVEEIDAQHADVFECVVAPALGVPVGLGPGIRSTIGKPGWRFYLAYDGSRPVAGAALHVQEGGGWLGLGATLLDDRGRGAQTALLARRIADARELGCAWVTADTLVTARPSQSRRNMERSGFVHWYDRPNYALDVTNDTMASNPTIAPSD